MIFRPAVLVSAVSLLLWFSVPAFGQQTVVKSIHIVHKEGTEKGQAVASLRGPVKIKGHIVVQDFIRKLNKDTVQAWPLADGTGALLLVVEKNRGRLRYYDADADKGRWLGTVPFRHATFVETHSAPLSVPWAFALAGTDVSSVVAGDREALHARLPDASEPHFRDGVLLYSQNGQPKQVSLSLLLGLSTEGRIFRVSTSKDDDALIQFFRDGHTLRFAVGSNAVRGEWLADGSTLHVVEAGGAKRSFVLSELQTENGIPADARLVVRLTGPLSSRTAKSGMPVEAVLISPGTFDEKILLPQGTIFSGEVENAHGVGLGIKHESAALKLHFSHVELPDGRSMPMSGRIAAVENARETVKESGKIQGIRSTGTIGHTAENQISSLAQADPIAYIFTSSAGPAVLGFAEPEILYDSGTEVQVLFERPLVTSKAYPPASPHIDLNGTQGQDLQQLVRHLPFRTETLQLAVPSDLTNLVFIGQPDALLRAFQASGWTTADSLTSSATFQTMKTLTGNQIYTQAPMSVLVLNQQRPLYTLQKTTNTFSSRHHLRIFDTGEKFAGQPLLTASSTQDIGIDFSYKQRTFIHVIDQNLDNERAKVINDLEFTGCVRATGMVARPAVPLDAYNSTGDRLRTDGSAGVIELNDCMRPHAVPPATAERARKVARTERNVVLSAKDTLYRGNLVYTGISGALKINHFLATRNELAVESENWRHTDASDPTHNGTAGRRYDQRNTLDQRLELSRTLSPESQNEIELANRALIKAHKWDAPRFEIGLNLGYSYHRNNILEVTVLDIASPDVNKPQYLLGLGDATYDGWAAGVSLTANTWKWFSNEISYMREQTKFDLIADTISSDSQTEPVLDVQTVGLTTRRFAYDFVAYARPRTSRWRPYIMAGPAFQLVSLSDAPLKKPSGYFRLGLSNIGLFKAAFDFGRTAPLDGGGIFQAGLQYGAGIKYRLTPRVMIRGDYGETWSPNPHIINKSYDGYLPDGLDETYTTTVTNYGPSTRYFQQHATVGFAFTF